MSSGSFIRLLAFIIPACFCLNQTATAAPNGVQFSGKILNNSGSPLQDAYVILDEGKYYDVTNNRGHFLIRHIKPGTYRLVIKIIGYHTYSQSISIGKNGLKNYTIHLEPKNYHLKSIVVTATRTRKMMEDVPLPLTVIKQDKIKDTGSMRLGDILSELTGLRWFHSTDKPAFRYKDSVPLTPL